MEKNTGKPYYIVIAFAVIILILILGYLILVPKPKKYAISNQELLDNILLLEDEIFPEDVFSIIEYGDSGYYFVDIRTPHQFQNSHISGAVNIAVHDFLEWENIKIFDQLQNDSTTVVIYGSDQRQANGAWMFLKQLGYNNIKVMLGGYDYYTTGPLDLYDMPDIPEYLVEEPICDFAAEIETLGGSNFESTPSEGPEVVVPARKKKKAAAEGGC
jgi:rhodanese-related sulfurtransferase